MILAILLAALLFGGAAVASSWNIQVIDSPGQTNEGVGTDSSLDFGPGDTPHISYFDDENENLKYARFVGAGNGNCGGTAWQCDVVDGSGNGNVGKDTSIDASGQVSISYYDVGNRDLKYARLVSGVWTTEVVDTGGGASPTSSTKVGQHTSLDIDAAGNAHISYFSETDKDLRYAVYVGNGAGNCGGPNLRWQCYAIEAAGDVGRYSSLDLDASGKAHISYFDQSDSQLHYAKEVGSGGNCGGGKFECETVDTGGTTGRHTSIVVDADGYPQISYLAGSGSGHILKYACKSASGWTIQTIESVGLMGDDNSRNTSLEIGRRDNRARIAYQDQTGGDLRYAMNVEVCGLGGVWVTQAVDTEGQVGSDPSLALDSGDSPCISYYDQTNKRLKYTCWGSQPPALGLTCPVGGATHWASMADYNNGVLSVNYTIINGGPVINGGTVDAHEVKIVANTTTNGVTTASTLPMVVATVIPANTNANFTIKYNIPTGVTSFKSAIYATAQDAGGVVYNYPCQPPSS